MRKVKNRLLQKSPYETRPTEMYGQRKKKKKDFSLAPLDHCHHANVILAAD